MGKDLEVDVGYGMKEVVSSWKVYRVSATERVS